MLTKEQKVAELWRRGELSFLFHDGQKIIDGVFRSSPGALVVFNIARQWGKTFWAVSKANEVANQVPGAKIRYAAAFETDLAEFVIPAFEAVLLSCPESQQPKYNVQKKKFLYPNGSEVKLVGLDKKPNGLRGNTIDLIILDEAGFISNLPYLYSSVIVPLTTHRPNAKIIVISTPPESPDHAFWEFVDRAKLENSYATFTIDENPMLSLEDIARIEREMGGRHTTAFQREYLCKKVVEEERAIIPEWDSTQFIAEHKTDALTPFWHRYLFMDMGVKDLTVVLFAHYNFAKAALIVEDEVVTNGPSLTMDTLAADIHCKRTELWGESQKIYRYIADNNNPLLLQTLAASHSLYFAPVEKAGLHEMVNAVREFVRAGRVIVNPKCKYLLGSLESGIWDKNRREFDRSKVYGHYDALAALVYGIRTLDQSTNPVPQNYGVDLANTYANQKKPISDNARELKQLFGIRRR